MKITKIIATLIFTMMLSVVVYAENNVPYKSLYYDGANHTYTANKINLNINDTVLEDSELPMQPINIDGSRTLVPLREVFEALGAKVEYYGATNQVIIRDGENVVQLTVGSTIGKINGTEVTMDTAPKYVSLDSASPKKVMIPLRFVGEGLGYTVHYDSATRTVYVRTAPQENNTGTTDNTNTTPNVPKVKLTQKNSAPITSSAQSTTTISEIGLPTSSNKVFTIDTSSAMSNVKIIDLGDGRLVIDVENSKYTKAGINQNMSVDTLTNIRVAQFATTPTYITRAVLTFSNDTNYSINLSTDRKRFTLVFSSSDTLPTIPSESINAKSVAYSSNGETDSFVIAGDTKAPVLSNITAVDTKTLNIDILKPNTISDTSKSVSGVSVANYKISSLNDTTTRLQVTLNGDFTYTKTVEGNNVRISIKPKATSGGSNSNGDISDETSTGGVVSVSQTDNSVTVKVDKKLAGIDSVYNTGSITHTDAYLYSKYTLTMPISLQSQLGSSDTVNVNNNILSTINILSDASTTKFVFFGKKVLNVDVTQDGAYLYFTVRAARDVYDTIIVIDPGHGGTDPGTGGTLNGTTYYEKNVVLDIGKKVNSYITQGSNFKVYMTRTSDVFVELYDRPAFSNALEADAFVSIHADAAGTMAANGITTFYFDVDKEDAAYLAAKGIYSNDVTKKTTALSKSLAEQVQKNLISTTLVTNRGAKHGNYAVLRHNSSPAILIETGFMSNQRDLANLADEAYRTKVAKSIANTIIAQY